MRRPLSACLALCLHLGLGGCGASYNTLVHIERPPHQSASLEQERIESAVSGVARSFDLQPVPDRDGVRQSVEKDGSVPFRVIAEYARGKSRDTSYANVVLLVTQDKKSGEFDVRIRTLGTFTNTSFGQALEEAIRKALENDLPAHTVTVERGFEPLLLGP